MENPVHSGMFAAFGAMLFPVAVLAQNLPRVETVSECFVQTPEGLAANGGTDCGYVAVPQSRSGGPEGEVRLAYMRIRAAGEPAQAPLFMLAGGPGQTGITDDKLLLFQPELLGAVLATRDVVLMEQRGTFRSKPSLVCPEAPGATFDALIGGMESEAARDMVLDRMRTCVARHEAEGVDFGSYNNVESAADVNDVRAALGYDKIVYYGASYATLLGEYVMDQFPDTLAAVILDGTETRSGRSWIENRAVNAQWGIDNLTRLCTGQPGCAEAFDIPALVDEALGMFDDGPITVSVPLPEGSADADEVDVTITADDLAQQIYALQTSKYGVAALPVELSQLISGGREALGQALGEEGVAKAIAERGDTEIGMMTLMHAAMVCSDDPVRSLDEVKSAGVGRYAKLFAQSAGTPYVDLCKVMNVPQLPDSLDQDVETDVPVLIFSGGLDVQTPYFQSEKVAERLLDTTHVIFPAGFHVQIANINRCAIRIAVAFLDAPETDPDLGCVADERPLPFVLPDDLKGAAE